MAYAEKGNNTVCRYNFTAKEEERKEKKRKLMKPVIHRSAKYCSMPHKLDLIVKREYKVLSLLLQTADSLQTRIK